MIRLNICGEDKILVLAPHPDDECLGCASLLLKYPMQCDVILVTDGSHGIVEKSKEQTKQIRQTEFMSAMQYLGIERFKMLSLEDQSLAGQKDYLGSIDLSKYMKIFVTGKQEKHVDHQALFDEAVKACIEQKINPEIYSYEVHTPLQNPTHFVEVNAKKKRELLSCYPSQLEIKRFDEQALALNKFRACEIRREDTYMEAFEKIDITREGIQSDSAMREKLAKFQHFFRVQNIWIRALIENMNVGDLLRERNISSTAIYGYGDLGKTLHIALKRENVKVDYVIDNVFSGTGLDIPVYNMKDKLPEVDLIIVTAVYYYHEIERELKEHGMKEIVSLEELFDSPI